jgi:hypothetical protein
MARPIPNARREVNGSTVDAVLVGWLSRSLSLAHGGNAPRLAIESRFPTLRKQSLVPGCGYMSFSCGGWQLQSDFQHLRTKHHGAVKTDGQHNSKAKR